MTRKDYILIAAAIKAEQRHGREGDETINNVARSIADALQSDNPRFDRARFLKAAGVTE